MLSRNVDHVTWSDLTKATAVYHKSLQDIQRLLDCGRIYGLEMFMAQRRKTKCQKVWRREMQKFRDEYDARNTEES